MGKWLFSKPDTIITMIKEIFNRTERLLGKQTLNQLANTRVIIFGVGGVGSWAAEALIRSGIGKLTIVDSDCVSVSNVNRQLMATVSTIGEPKVIALRQRLLDINPNAEITAIQDVYTEETASTYDLDSYDYVIDAIDSLTHKAHLILMASACKHAKLFSSMGAALKLDPTRIQTAEFWNVKGCPLAAALRRKFKRNKTFPKHKFRCVFSDEVLPNLTDTIDSTVGTWDVSKAQTNGSLMHITSIFGITLAGLIIQEIHKAVITKQ